MYYGEDVIEEVRARNDILDVISGAVHLEKRGGNYVGLCPFHNEKTPSFTVTPAKQMFYCFGCGVGGNVYSFVQKYENITFREAVEQLADRAGYALPKAAPSAAEQKKREQKDILLAINKEAAIWFFHRLREDAGKAGMQYFIRRGLTPEIMQRFGLGFAPVSRDGLCTYLREKGYRDADIVAAGVAVRDEQHGLRDKFWNRVIFPIQDVNKRVIGFGGRVLGDGEPKYLNSPETPVFDKSRNLYGLCYARAARKGHILLCEGYMDVIAMHQAGFTQAAASLGTSFTIGQANILKRYTDDVYLAYDSDTAGKAAVLRASA
ncbi:MAG: DNA primase, partial [Lachnospiraceae bacterium]|nr:DNA primase [Lachnospiraceae bacterium]